MSNRINTRNHTRLGHGTLMIALATLLAAVSMFFASAVDVRAMLTPEGAALRAGTPHTPIVIPEEWVWRGRAPVSVATAEAMWLAKTLFRDEPTPVDHENVPTAVFANPNLATVGLSEEKARERYGAIDVYKTSFRALKLTMSDKAERTFMKLVVDRASQRVVGAHMIGADAGEIIQGIAIAVKLGATKAQFDATIGIHPTAAEEFVTMREKTA